MYVNKKVLITAIAGVLLAGNAAAVNISTPADPAIVFAREINAAVPGGVQLLTSVPAGGTLDWDINYNFSDGEVRYARVEVISGSLQFDPASVVTTSNGGADIGSVNGLGTNVLTFSLTSNAPGNIVGTDTLTVTGDHTITSTAAPVVVQVSLYDQPSQALAGGAAGRINVQQGTYVTFGPSFQFVATPGQAVADVEAANGAYTDFVSPPGDGIFGELTFDLAPTVPYKADGTLITLSDLFAANTSVAITGDLSAATDLDWNGTLTDTLTGSTATYVVGSTANSGDVEYLENGTGAIQESSYTAVLTPVANTGYVIGSVPSVNVGEIIRNGTELQAPLAQVPGGWLSRLVLTNTGNADRPYTITVLGENGNTISTANLTGTVPANGTHVINDLNDVLTGFTAAPRATLVVRVSGPNNQIQGLYQIVNPNSGSISNHVLVRPGTN